jgi:Raf kinase inhibitor-like YbhB/YbcL family protein
MKFTSIARAVSISAGVAFAAIAGSATARAQSFTITSADFKDGGMLDAKHAGNNKANANCVGENVSPQFSWTNVPAGTKSFALIMVDPEGRGGLGVIHWVAYGIPGDVTGFAQGEVSKDGPKFVGGSSTVKTTYYFGPCTPPKTGYHHYTFTLIATELDAKDLPAGLSRDELFAKLNGKTKGSAGIVGLFGKP